MRFKGKKVTVMQVQSKPIVGIKVAGRRVTPAKQGQHPDEYYVNQKWYDENKDLLHEC